MFAAIELKMEVIFVLQELYQELLILDRFEQDYQRKRHEEDNSAANQKGDSSITFSHACLD